MKCIITVLGTDKVGIIAKVCTYLADNKLIEQIIINAEILNAKVIGHALFLWFILLLHYIIKKFYQIFI